MSHALSIHIFAPGKREEHNSEQNRKTDTNKQIKTKIKHREPERHNYLDRPISEHRPN